MVDYTSWMDFERDPLILVGQSVSLLLPQYEFPPRPSLSSKGAQFKLIVDVCEQLIDLKKQRVCFTWCAGACSFTYVCVVSLIRCVQPGWLDQRRPPSNWKKNTKVKTPFLKLCIDHSTLLFAFWCSAVQLCSSWRTPPLLHFLLQIQRRRNPV